MDPWESAGSRNGKVLFYPRAGFSVWGDRNVLYITYLFILITVVFIIIAVGFNIIQRWQKVLAILATMFVGYSATVSSLSNGWLVGRTTSACQYSAYDDISIRSADIHVMIGLTNANISVAGAALNHTVYHNERFSWTNVGEIQQEYISALKSGVPDVIVNILETFTVDSGGMRLGRQLRETGYYVNVLIWSSFATWLYSNVLLFVAAGYAAWHLVITGVLLLLCNIVYAATLPVSPSYIAIQFPDSTMTFSYGWAFWIILSAGIIALLCGLTLKIICYWFPGYLIKLGLGLEDTALYTVVKAGLSTAVLGVAIDIGIHNESFIPDAEGRLKTKPLNQNNGVTEHDTRESSSNLSTHESDVPTSRCNSIDSRRSLKTTSSSRSSLNDATTNGDICLHELKFEQSVVKEDDDDDGQRKSENDMEHYDVRL